MKRTVLAIATFAASPVAAHPQAILHVHGTDYTSLALGVSLISVASVSALIARKVRK